MAFRGRLIARKRPDAAPTLATARPFAPRRGEPPQPNTQHLKHMSYDSTPDSNGNRGGRNRRRRNRNGRGGKGAPPSGTRPAFKTLDERGGFEKFLHTISFGLLCKPKQSNRPQAPKTNVTVVSSNKDASSSPRPPRSDQPRAPREPRPAREYVPAKPEEVTTDRLYVGNLSYDATESDLFELFNGVGSVRNAEVVVHSRTQRSKGFAFVTMASIEEARRAVQELCNKEFMGRPLQISGAKPSNRGDRDERSEGESQPELDEATPAAA